METSINGTATPAVTQNDTLTNPITKSTSHNWAFLVAVLGTAISVSILIALLAKCQVIRRYLASYRHKRLREMDAVSQCDQSGLEVGFAVPRGSAMNPHCTRVSEEDDDGFIEDNYIPAMERARAERAAEILEDSSTEEQMDEIEFDIT